MLISALSRNSVWQKRTLMPLRCGWPIRCSLYPAVALTILVSAASPGYAQSKAQWAVCASKKSAVAIAYCDTLAGEFEKKRLSKNTYPLGDALLNPLNDEATFVGAFRVRAYEHILASTATGDAKSFGADAAQVLANDLAQVVSTKAAVTQTGSNATASGSTSLVAKPTTTDLISLAAESGAFTDTVNGNTITAQANMNGLRRYLDSKPFADLNPATADLLQHITLAATFNIAQSGSSATPSTGQATSSTPSGILSVILPSNNVSFNSLNVGVAAYRPYTPTSKSFTAAWAKALVALSNSPSVLATKLFTDYKNVLPVDREALFQSPAIQAASNAWGEAYRADESRVDSQAFSTFVGDFVAYFDAITAELEKDPNFDKNLVASASDLDGLISLRNRVIDAARGTPLVTFNYMYATPTGKPATHNATAVFAYLWSKDNGAQLTGNASGSWFATLPVGAKYGRVKDYQFSGEFDQPIGKVPSSPRTVFSVGGYAQYQYTANVLNITGANVVPGTDITVPANSQVFTSTPGWLSVAQTKLVFNIGKGATIPVAVKWSNKTDLLTGSDWKGQFGFSYDLSALSSILNGK